MNDFGLFLLVLAIPACCSLAARLRHALWWVPIVGALLTGAVAYGALSLSSEPMWAPVAGLFAVLWGYVLCFVFTLFGIFTARKKIGASQSEPLVEDRHLR